MLKAMVAEVQAKVGGLAADKLATLERVAVVDSAEELAAFQRAQSYAFA